MLIVDGDYPMSIVAMRMRRDVTLPMADLRASENADNLPMASLPALRRAYAIGTGQVAHYGALEAQGGVT